MHTYSVPTEFQPDNIAPTNDLDPQNQLTQKSWHWTLPVTPILRSHSLVIRFTAGEHAPATGMMLMGTNTSAGGTFTRGMGLRLMLPFDQVLFPIAITL